MTLQCLINNMWVLDEQSYKNIFIYVKPYYKPRRKSEQIYTALLPWYKALTDIKPLKVSKCIAQKST